ncbi:MAG: hypothetical protein M3Q03_18640 [Chloroflexota bacterium]|nr:hypothetical protein [Chloroflexota bacterium]
MHKRSPHRFTSVSSAPVRITDAEPWPEARVTASHGRGSAALVAEVPVASGWSTTASNRAVLLACVLLFTSLLALTCASVRLRDGAPNSPVMQSSAWNVPPLRALPGDTMVDVDAFRRMALNARLFHDAVPRFIALRIGYYALLAWSCVTLLWVIYLWTVWRVRNRRISTRVVACGGVALAVLAFSVPPVFSTDSFSYAMFGRLAAVYGANPYATTPASTAPADPLMTYVYWRDIPSPYGPLWTLLSQFTAADKHATPLELALRFKLIGLVATLLNGWLIYRLVRYRWPDRAAWAYLAYAWNPLVLVEGIVAAHNDALILTVVLIGAHLLYRARSELAIAALTVSGLIKYSTVPIAGIAALRLLLRTPLPRRLPTVARIAATSAVLVVAAFVPFWAGTASLAGTLSQPGQGVNNALLLSVAWGASAVTNGFVRIEGGTALTLLAGLLFGAWQIASLWRQRARAGSWAVHDELADWSATLAMLLLVFPRVYTWYFVVPLGLALAAGPKHRRAFARVLVLSMLSYSSYFS